MAFAGGLGAEVDLAAVTRSSDVRQNDWILFSESNSRFVCEVEADKKQEFEKCLSGCDFAEIGQVTAEPIFRATGLQGRLVVCENVLALKNSWQKTLKW